MTRHTPILAHEQVPDIYRAFIASQTAINAEALDPGLRHLVVLRASQINGCAFCVKMHIAEARRDGERDERLERLVVWRHVDDYTDAERAAFAWTEALTVIDPAREMEPLRAALRPSFDDRQIAALTALIAMINLWNRMQVASH